MGEPIYLWSKDGKPVVLYAPVTAGEMVAAGELFENPPSPLPEPPPNPGAEQSPLPEPPPPSLKELRVKAKAAGVKGYSRMSKAQLLAKVG